MSQDLADSMVQQARKMVAAEWLPATLCCDLTFQLIKMLSEQARTAAGCCISCVAISPVCCALLSHHELMASWQNELCTLHIPPTYSSLHLNAKIKPQESMVPSLCKVFAT